ncbi:hypothetical protein TYRP_004740 [Tyrophagus putrescentiae]|nr:hypothetical protein TYRP_004740 [Tyrophagus putrescentiae]
MAKSRRDAAAAAAKWVEVVTAAKSFGTEAQNSATRRENDDDDALRKAKCIVCWRVDEGVDAEYNGDAGAVVTEHRKMADAEGGGGGGSGEWSQEHQVRGEEEGGGGGGGGGGGPHKEAASSGFNSTCTGMRVHLAIATL